jgi:hypothetical protein
MEKGGIEMENTTTHTHNYSRKKNRGKVETRCSFLFGLNNFKKAIEK